MALPPSYSLVDSFGTQLGFKHGRNGFVGIRPVFLSVDTPRHSGVDMTHTRKTRGMIMRRFTVMTLVMAVALLTACDGDSTGNSGSIVGTYTLQTLNGMNLPVAPSGPPPPTPPGGAVLTFELTAGSVRLNSDDTCSLSLTFRTTIDGTVTATNTETDTCT